MPKSRPAASGYARLAQAEADDDDHSLNSEENGPLHSRSASGSLPQYESIQPKRRERMLSGLSVSSTRRPFRQRSNSGVDIKALNARLERWAEEIAQKFKIRRIRGKTEEEETLEIHHSVFQAPDWIRPATAEMLAGDYGDMSSDRITKLDFDDIVESVRIAIDKGMHPTLISQGSSGSYFARNSSGKVVGVFKPKDEEPYASRNPKWTKWIHRNLFPFFFGRACLIPNLSYVSEAAACVLDQQLRTNLVPYTDVVSLSSKSFFYDFWDRRAYYRKGKLLPEKMGSFQVFLKGYKDATMFLKEHPWPDQHGSGLRETRKKKRRWAEDCRPSGPQSEDEDESERPSSSEETRRREGFWSPALMQSFQEQLEKLVILDYIMRNTDRGLDNWMIKINTATQEAHIVAEPPRPENGARDGESSDSGAGLEPYKREERMMASSRSATPLNAPDDVNAHASISIGAIDNSLSWPWKHPDAWRSYPFGWLFLPASLIGRPFTEATRQHFLPLLTSKQWWSETQLALRRCFHQDVDFKERMFARQMAVMKGQAWNVVETLKTADHGPLELTRRTRVCVWDDLVDIPVAVPLRAPSSEMRRHAQANNADATNEEMDISVALASAPLPNHDLLNLGNSPDLGTGNRFNLSRQSSATDVRMSEDSQRSRLSSTATVEAIARKPVPPAGRRSMHSARTSRFIHNSSSRVPQSLEASPRAHRRHFSFSARGLGQNSFYGDEDEGDLGYAAAEDMEDNLKKVIVERLETVKSKAPVFTWC